MLRHYLKIGFRNLWKNKGFTAINILGLTIGLTCCLLMAFYIQYELNYDRFQAKGDRIARVIMEYSFGGSVSKGNYTSTKVAPSFKKNFPEVEDAVRMNGGGNRIVKYGEKVFVEKRFLFADSTFFNIFSFSLVRGNPLAALSGPNKLVLTRTAAKKYFGGEDPIGKIVYVGSGAIAYEVTGIAEDGPENSQIKFDFIASFSSLGANQETTYYEANYTTYLLLKNSAGIASLQAKIPAFMKKEMSTQVSGNDYVTYELEPYQKIHLHSAYDGFEPNNSITYIYIIGAVALLILLIACFTYINLSTARSMERAREVGVRKVTGAQNRQIFIQFIGESVILSVAALLLSILLAVFLLPAFNNLADKQIGISVLWSPFSLLFCLGVIICISLLAGSYPAFVLAELRPVRVLKGAFKNTGSALWLRKSLIVFQFVISSFLIISTFIIQKQLYFIHHKKLGYDREHVIVLPMDQKILSNIQTLKAQLKAVPGVENLSRAVNDPTNIKGGYNMRSDAMPEATQVMVTANPVDEDFVKTTGLQIIAGTDFTGQDVKDVVDAPKREDRIFHFILNESAAKALGWTSEEAVGKKMFLGNQRPGRVKAVVKDFHFTSLHNPIKPLVLFNDEWSSVLLVKVSGNNLPQTLASLAATWKAVVPHRPFDYHFLDEDYNNLYRAEMRTGKVLNIFSLIAILLAAAGLMGLSAYAAQQRTKEIGIRKVLGAGIFNLVTLLTKDFVKMVALASVLAFPLAWYAMHTWLQDFTYRIEISWWIFAASGFLSISVAVITVGFQ
ncbi:MAG: FtsX-like permease family protein, partial [Sediminibacterium sp.]|nr:FtsX-like permease family protein [Sediminibacterium sp.]